jgi:predicted amidohydrolase
MGEGQPDRWGLPGDPDLTVAEEDISLGLDMTVLESTLGRIAVLICEDVKQSTTWEAKFRAFGVSHLFIPLFASPISRSSERWDRQAAQRCVETLGSWVVLANSLAVGAEMHAQPPLDPEDCFNCVVVGPGSRRPTRHGDYDSQFCRADNVADVSRVHYRNDTELIAQDGTPLPLPTVGRGWALDTEPSEADRPEIGRPGVDARHHHP